MQLNEIFDSGVNLTITALFYTITNTSPSTRGIMIDYWNKVESTRHGRHAILAAEMLGIGLRCFVIWLAALYLTVHPEINLYLCIGIFGFAMLYIFNKTIRKVKAPSKMGPTTAFCAIVLAELLLNIDNVLATMVDVSMDALSLSLVAFWFLILVLKVTSWDDKGLAWIQHKFENINQPKKWWASQTLTTKVVGSVLFLSVSLIILPLLPLAWRILVGLKRTYGNNEELTNGTWVFILVLLGLVAIFDYPAIASACLPINQITIQWFIENLDLSMSQSAAHEVLKILSGTLFALVTAFFYLPFFERRAAAKRILDSSTKLEPSINSAA